MSSARHDRFSNLGVATAGNIATAGLSIIYVAIVGRRLGPALYADFNASLAVAYVLIAALTPIATVTVQAASAASASHGRAAAFGAWRPVFAKSAPAATALLVLAAVAGPLVVDAVDIAHASALYMALAVAAVAAFVNVLRSLPRAVGDYGVHAAASTGEGTLRLILGALLLAAFATPAVALGAYVIAGVVAAAVLLYITRKGTEPPPYDSAWSNFAGALILSVGTSLAGNIDILIARSRLVAADAGVYGAAATIARAAAYVLLPIEILLLPALAHAGRSASQTLARLAGFAVLAAGGLIVVFAVFGEVIVTIFFGTAYAAAATILVILALNTAFMFAILLTGQFFLHERRIGFLSIVAAVPIAQIVALLMFGHSMRSIAITTAAVQGAGFAVAAAAALFLLSRERS